MQAEMAVEWQRPLIRPRGTDSDCRTALVIPPFGMGNHNIEAVEGAAQKDDDESLGPAFGGARGDTGRQQDRAGGQPKKAAPVHRPAILRLTGITGPPRSCMGRQSDAL